MGGHERKREKETIFGAPVENFSRGLVSVDIPELGTKTGTGKVRDIWVVDGKWRVMVTSDRLSAYDRLICSVPGKGVALNLLSAHWFTLLEDVIPNHVIDVPHPRVLIAKQAQATVPVEVVFRRFLARSRTPTSVYNNYFELGRREIYGIKFPEGLLANREFPGEVGRNGTILTPTTKSQEHDQELTGEEARAIVDNKFGEGTWQKIESYGYELFERARTLCLRKGLILADTKFEFGFDEKGNLMVIDELLTSDSSRFWRLHAYYERVTNDKDPEGFDKERIRRWLADNGFRGEGEVPSVDPSKTEEVAQAYKVPYYVMTGEQFPDSGLSDSPRAIKEAIFQSLEKLQRA